MTPSPAPRATQPTTTPLAVSRLIGDRAPLTENRTASPAIDTVPFGHTAHPAAALAVFPGYQTTSPDGTVATRIADLPPASPAIQRTDRYTSPAVPVLALPRPAPASTTPQALPVRVPDTPLFSLVAQRDEVESGPMAAEPEPAASPVAATPAPEPTSAPEPSSASAASTAAPPAAAGGDPEELAKKLFDPLLRRLKTELRLDRERRGRLTDLWQ